MIQKVILCSRCTIGTLIGTCLAEEIKISASPFEKTTGAQLPRAKWPPESAGHRESFLVLAG